MRSILFVHYLFFLLVPLLVFGQESSVASSNVQIIDVALTPVVEINGENDYSSMWFSGKEDIIAQWTLTEEIVAVAADVSTVSGIEPQTGYRPPISYLAIDSNQLIEGENFLTVQFRNEEKWGTWVEKVLLVDRTPPEEFSIKTDFNHSNGKLNILFSTNDKLSGVSYYDIIINNTKPIRLTKSEAIYGYQLDASEPATYNIRVVAVDFAGNERDANATFVVTNAIKTEEYISNPFELFVNEPATALAAVMAGLMLLMFGYMVYERQLYSIHLDRVRIEAEEIQSHLLRVFTALREEVYEQIQAIDKKKRLSKAEKEAVMALNKALDVSETLIEKEIKDVKDLTDK